MSGKPTTGGRATRRRAMFLFLLYCSMPGDTNVATAIERFLEFEYSGPACVVVFVFNRGPLYRSWERCWLVWYLRVVRYSLLMVCSTGPGFIQ